MARLEAEVDSSLTDEILPDAQQSVDFVPIAIVSILGEVAEKTQGSPDNPNLQKVVVKILNEASRRVLAKKSPPRRGRR